MELKIYNQGGSLKATVSPADSSTHTHELMGENVVSVTFTYPEYLTLDVNDYVDIEGVTYTLRSTCEPVQKSTLEYTYNVKFYGKESEAYRVRMLHSTDGEYETKFSLDGNPLEHLQKVVGNLNRIYQAREGGIAKKWGIGSYITAPNQNIEYSNVSCTEALSKIAETFDTEWWLEGDNLCLGRCEVGERIELGYMQGLTNLTRADNENVPFFTRLIPLGGTRNINRESYGNTRLQLPGGVKYVEQNIQYGLYEAVEEEAFAGIYPHRVGKVTSVRSTPAKGENGDFTIYYFKDGELDFNPDEYILPGLKLRVVFQSGELNGRDFEVAYKDGEFEITNEYPTDKTQIPGSHLIPKENDTYILYNMEMPREYITAAEKEFEQAVYDYLAKYSIDTAIYRGDTDYVYVGENNINLRVGLPVRLLADNYFKETGFRDSRITRITRNLSNLGKATIECTNAIGKGRIASIEGDVNDIKALIADRLEVAVLTILRSWESGDATDANVYSALRTIREIQRRALRKDVPDETRNLISLLGGLFVKEGIETDDIEVGEYAPGFLGSGARINEDGVGEMTGLKLREFLEVPELRFNRIDVISGETWNTFAFGKFSAVDTENRVATVDLLDGELLGIHVNDICRGIFHNLSGNNEAGEGKDECGFQKMVGFSTAYFTPMEILPDGKSFRYALKSGTTVHPCAEMKFACYGNFTDKSRQASAYSTRTTSYLLANVNTWEINPSRNYMFVAGLLDGITIGGKELHGYSTYQCNNYISGATIQFTPEQLADLRGHDAYSVSLSTYEGVAVLDYLGNIVDMHNEYNVVSEEKNIVSGDENVIASRYQLTTRVQAFRGAQELRYSKVMDTDSYIVTAYAKGCEYSINGGVITVSNITDTSNAYIDLEVNCEGMALFTKHYQISFVRDGKPGEDGGDGDPAIGLNLTSDTDAIACNASGIPLSSGTLATTTAMFYVGGVNISTDVNFTYKATGCTISQTSNTTGIISVTGITADKATVEVTATYGTLSIKALYTLVKVKGGTDGVTPVIYQLIPSTDVVQVKNGVVTPSSVSCRVRKITGDKVEDNGSTYGLIRTCSIDGGIEAAYTGTSIMVTSSYKYITFFLYSGGTLLDSEKVPVVSDGTDGKGGKDGATYLEMYKYSADKPTEQPGSFFYTTDAENLDKGADYSYTNGWTFGLPKSPVLSYNIVKTGSNEWRIVDDYYTSPAISSGNERMKLSFATTEPNQIVRLKVKVSSGTNCYGYVLNPDTDATPNTGNTQFYDYGTREKELAITIATPGQHYIIVGYNKTGSASGSDWFQFKPIYASKLWSTTAFAYLSGGRWWDVVGDYYTRWSDPVMVDDLMPSVTLVSTISQISRNSLGSIVPSSFMVYAQDSSGNKQSKYYLSWWRSTDGLTWTNGGVTIGKSEIQVMSSGSYKFYKVIATVGYPASMPTTYMADVQILLVADGDRGDKGEKGDKGDDATAGSMPRNCYLWSSEKTYAWDKNLRDIVYMEDGTVWMVNVFGMPVTTRPSEGSLEWVQGNKETFTAIDTALIDGADIAGFLYKDEKMISRRGKFNGVEKDISDLTEDEKKYFIPNISLDGKTGQARLISAELENVTVSGFVAEPFERYNSLEEFAKGVSMSWCLTVPAVNALNEGARNNNIFSIKTERYNGTTLRMYNATDMDCYFRLTPALEQTVGTEYIRCNQYLLRPRKIFVTVAVGGFVDLGGHINRLVPISQLVLVNKDLNANNHYWEIQ